MLVIQVEREERFASTLTSTGALTQLKNRFVREYSPPESLFQIVADTIFLTFGTSWVAEGSAVVSSLCAPVTPRGFSDIVLREGKAVKV